MKVNKVSLSVLIPGLATSLTIAYGKGDDQKIFSPKYIQSTMEAAVKWQFANPNHDPRDWTNGACYAGVYAALIACHQERRERPFQCRQLGSVWHRRFFLADSELIKLKK